MQCKVVVKITHLSSCSISVLTSAVENGCVMRSSMTAQGDGRVEKVPTAMVAYCSAAGSSRQQPGMHAAASTITAPCTAPTCFQVVVRILHHHEHGVQGGPHHHLAHIHNVRVVQAGAQAGAHGQRDHGQRIVLWKPQRWLPQQCITLCYFFCC